MSTYDQKSFYLNETIRFCIASLREYLEIYGKFNTQYEYMETVYTQTIIVNLAKIFSDSCNEKFSLDYYKCVCSCETRNQIEIIESANEDLINKILSSRNKLFAHTDKKFYNMGYSAEEIADREKAFGIDLSKFLAKEKKNERYLPKDLFSDANKLLEMLNGINKLIDNENYLKYLKSK